MREPNRTTQYRTPRTLSEAFGPYSTLPRNHRREPWWSWLTLIGLAIALGLILGWRG